MNTLLSMLPLILIIALLWGGYVLFKKKQGPQVPGPNGETPYGVHGILAFFIFASYFIAPLFTLAKVNSAFMDAELQNPSILTLSGWGNYKMMSFALTIALVIWQILIARQLRWQLVPKSLTNAKILCFGAPIVAMASDVALAKMTLNVSPNGEAIAAYLGGLIVSWIWGLYFVFSKRCKNTYV